MLVAVTPAMISFISGSALSPSCLASIAVEFPTSCTDIKAYIPPLDATILITRPF